MKKAKGIDGRLDDAWSLLVKLRAGNMCEYCMTSRNLNSHHIYARNKKSIRWYVLNGVCLCALHHVFSTSFSAHLTPTEFTEWLYMKKGKDFMTRLKIKANGLGKFTKFEKGLLLKELKKEIKKYEKDT